MIKESFFACFLEFEFLNQTDYFDGRFSKSSHFSIIWCFLKRVFAQNNSNMIKESFFACVFEF